MSNNISDLPRFEKPPVVETVLGVFFRGSDKFTSAEQGVLWDRHFRAEFPNVEERPLVNELLERFGEERLGIPTVQWTMRERPDSPRLWATSDDGQHVVQIQRNGFLTNWQKASDGSSYRSYQDRREDFSGKLRRLEEFFEKQELGRMEPTSWLVTYINHIDCGDFDQVGPVAAKILTVWTNQFSDEWLENPDKLVLDFAFPLRGNVGRLNVKLNHVFMKRTKRHALRLDLTARGRLDTKDKDMQGVLRAIDLGHEWVVRGFASLTRAEIHKDWKRIQ